MEETKMKICSKCGKELPATDEYFYKELNGKLKAMCKDCKKDIYKNKTNFNFDDWYDNKKESFKNSWSYDDLKWLYDNYLDITKPDILKYFKDRKYKTINNIICQWDIRKESKNSNWDEDEIDMLYMYYPNSDQEELLEMFDRSWVSIKMKASRLGVTRSDKMLHEIISKAQTGKTISMETRLKQSQARKGVNNANWKGGISTLVPFFRGQLYEWKIKSFEAYDFKCALTNENKGNLEVHHTHKNFTDILIETFKKVGFKIEDTIEGYSEEEIKELVNVFNSLHFEYGLGVPLDKNVHKLFHTTYGLNNNTEKQFKEFKEMYLNNKFDDALKIMEANENVKPKKRKTYKRLTKEKVIKIREDVDRGFPTSYIASKFNCSNLSVYNIRVNKSWKNVV